MMKVKSVVSIILAVVMLSALCPVYASGASVQLTSEHSAYMSGYGNGYFGANDPITWAQVCSIIYDLLADKTKGRADSAFSDVSEDAWYYEAVTVLASRGILSCDGGELNPDSEITRGEFIVLVMNLAGVNKRAKCPFEDISPEDECYAAVSTAYEKGYINGISETVFGADEPLTRAQAVKILNGILSRSADISVVSSASDLRVFLDVSPEDWYYNDVMEAAIDHKHKVSNGSETWTEYTSSYPVTYIYSGTSYTEMVYEGECAALAPSRDSEGRTISGWIFPSGEMKNLSTTQVYGPTSYTAWYAPELTSEHSAYMTGFDDGSFRPEETVTRSELAQVIYSLLKSKNGIGFPNEFTDVDIYTPGYTAISVLASIGLIQGGGEFRPGDTLTHSELGEIVRKFAPQAEVPEDDSPVTRAELAVYVNIISGRKGDGVTESKMDERHLFTDVSSDYWAYNDIMEAAVSHTYTASGTGEAWLTYFHDNTGDVDWESSESVIAAAGIVTSITSTYGGNFDHEYNWDYTTAVKEEYVRDYASETNYLIWVSRQNQKVYVFYGEQGSWELIHNFICATGKPGHETPVGVTYITYRQTGWFTSSYTVAPVVRFYPGSGYAFHSREYYPHGSTKLLEADIGYPVSHGCVRMLDEDVTYIYNWVPGNTTVIVY